MTQRRRFFPSRPAQQLPGRSVELGLQLSKSGQAVPSAGNAAPSDTAGIVGVALFPAMLPYLDSDFHPTEPVVALLGMQDTTLLRPYFESWRLVGGYVGISNSGPYVFDAVVIGSSAQAVTWTWTLDIPEELPPYNFYDPADTGVVSWQGMTVEEQAGGLRITVLAGELPVAGPSWYASLTCIASVGEEVVGRIAVRPGFTLIANYIPLPV